MLDIKKTGDLAQTRRLENAEAEAYRLGAVLEYVAMEADVEIPIDDSESENGTTSEEVA